ncbi:MAG: glycosyltransferase family 2 protein [Kaiparowitsia implicata GSE-PSE-MK54-09C]|jgi:glycosyltransferase involved in cell wall biosynthesis|nr:glycosyltransferase family 2 protein [Kaiparowitsia implicata GSE-PSE-MK54-09C]
MSPIVSVIIPSYNAMAYLPDTLASVLNQTFQDFEVLIINDGSTDHITDWMSTITDPRVRCISQENRGLSEARNTGIQHAAGELLAFLDADDLWDVSKLEKQVQYFRQYPEAGVVYTWSQLVDEAGTPTGRLFASSAEGNIWEALLLDSDVISNGSSAMVRKACFDAVGVFDASLTSAEDLDMWLRITPQFPFKVIKEPLTLYRQAPGSMSKNRERMVRNLCVVIDRAFESALPEKLYLRDQVYAGIYLNLAWLKLDESNYPDAIQHGRQALFRSPQILFSQQFLRFGIATVLGRLFGPYAYKGFKGMTQLLRRQILRLSTQQNTSHFLC